MGRTEKLVVLAVLFAAALVLALSFTRGGDEVEASDPLGGAREIGGEAGGAALLSAGESERSGANGFESGSANVPADGVLAPGQANQVPASKTAPSPLLNAGLTDEGVEGSVASAPRSPESTLAADPQSDPTHRILLETSGLRPSFMADYKVYTVAAGDTWSSLAQRFYQDGRYTRNLHLANEDLEELAPGKDILVPVFDFISVDAGLQAGTEAAPLAPMSAGAPLDGGATRASAIPPASAKALEYEVRAGDTLSDISLAVFGTATRWKEILEANRDKLQKPEALQTGMKLRIPEGGKLPAPSAAKPEAKKAEPKTAQGEKSPAATTPKKKKVL